MPEHIVATAAVVAAIAAVCALVVSMIRARKSLSEFFEEKDQPIARSYRWFTRTTLVLFGMLWGAIGPPHSHRADEIAAAPPEPLAGSGLLAVNAVFLGLSALFCSRVFLLTDLNSHAILTGDPALMNWQLQWVSRALYTDPLNLFNGNTFHPHPNVVALTDHMLSLAVINAPLSILSDSPWFGYNLLIFLAYYLSCVGGYWFMREVTGSRQAGFWAGIFWAFLFFRIHHIGHLQVLSFQWMPFVAATLIRFLRSPTGARTLALSACFVAQALVSWYHAVITTILVLVLSVLHIGRQRLTLRHAASAAAAAALCAAVILPTAIPYRRSLDETTLGSRYAAALVPGDRVSVSSYLEPPLAMLLGQMRQAGPWIWGEQTLYVGYTALALALAGLLIRRPRHLTPDGDAPPRTVDTRWIATGICLVIVGFVLAKGFVSSQQVRLPLLHLSEAPGLDFLKGLRATQRFSLLLYFGIMILSGAGAATLAARCRSARSAWIAISLVCLMFLAEVYPIRLPFEPRPYEISRLDVAIPKIWRDETRAPVVVHFPIHYFLRAYATPEAVYMLDSTHHWARVVNGFSGASPRGFRQTMEALNALPESRGVAALVELGVDLVAIHRSAPAASRRSLAAFFEEAPWATVYHVGDEHLVRIDPTSIPAKLVGVTAAGFRGTERAAGRAFRWTTGAARLSVPIDPLAPPSELAVDVLMTGRPKRLRIIVAGDCVLFDDTIRNRWSGTFALDTCRLTAPTLEVELLSDTHVPNTSDNRTLGIGVAAVELRGGGQDAALAFP